MLCTNMPAGIYFCRLPSFSCVLSKFVVVFGGGETLMQAYLVLPRAGTLSSVPRGGNGSPIHHSCLENPADREPWLSHGCTRVPQPESHSLLPPHPIPLGQPSAPALSTLSHASNLDWRSVSHIIIHMFQCYSLRSSHPCHLPQSPKDCTIHLCLFCCLIYRAFITIFLNSIYMPYFTVLAFFFLTHFTLYNRLQFSSTSLEVIQMYSFCSLSIPLCICTTTFFSTHLLMNI